MPRLLSFQREELSARLRSACVALDVLRCPQIANGSDAYVLKIAAANAECRGFCDAAATLGMLEMENDAMGLIAQAGVSVPEPLAGKSGSKIIRLEQLGGACEETGTCFVRLITFLGGTLLAEVPE